MLVDEYTMRMEAYKLKRLDEKYDTHLQAYLNHAVKATKKVGKSELSIYPKFEDFFNYEKELNELKGVSKKKNDVDGSKLKMLKINTEIYETGGE